MNPGEDFDEFEHSKELIRLQAGDSFGEIALSQACKRTASVKCSRETHLATLFCDDYNEIIGKYHEYLYNKKIRWLQTFSCLKQCKKSTTIEIFKKMVKFDARVDNYIYKEGDKPKYIYFLEEGEIKVLYITLPTFSY